MIRAASFGDMPQGPYATEAELLAALTAWAGDPTADGGAFSIAERGERLLPGNAKRGATRRVRCDRAGKPRSNGKSRENTLSKKCNCPWEVWIEEAKEGWVTSVFTKAARERALEMRAYSIHEIHRHPLLDTAVAPAVRLKRRRENDDQESEEAAKFIEEVKVTEGKQKVVNKRSMQEILDEREILMKGGEKPSIRNGGKPVEDEQLKKVQASWERKARRLAIYHYYVNILGSPPPEKWKQKGKGNDGTIGTIQKALKIPHGQRKLIENVLQEVKRCREKGFEYTGERAQHSGTLGRPVLIPTDSEDAKVIAQAYQDGVSVKKTVVLVNQQRKEREGEDATETTEAAVYSCLNRLKEESLASAKINSRNRAISRNTSQNRPTVFSKDRSSTASNESGVNKPYEQEIPLGADERNQDIDCPPNQNQKPDDVTEQIDESQSARNAAQEKQDAKSWSDLMGALRNRGYECNSVDEIVETFVAGKRHIGEDTAARKRHRVEANESESNTPGSLLQPSASEGLDEGSLLAAASEFARAAYDSSNE